MDKCSDRWIYRWMHRQTHGWTTWKQLGRGMKSWRVNLVSTQYLIHYDAVHSISSGNIMNNFVHSKLKFWHFVEILFSDFINQTKIIQVFSIAFRNEVQSAYNKITDEIKPLRLLKWYRRDWMVIFQFWPIFAISEVLLNLFMFLFLIWFYMK